MENLIVEVSKYLMIILFACYAYECFSAFRSRISTEKRNHIFDRQIFLMYLIHLDAFLVLYTVTDEINLIILYFLQVILVTIVIVNYQLLYPKASRLVTNNMCMLLMVGFIMLTRLSYEKAIRQYAIAICASVITIVIPVLIRKVQSLRRLTWLYAMIGIVGLAAVTIFGSTSYGAKISVTIGGLFSIQPSEFVKILFVFFVAGMLYKNTDFKTVCITTIVAAVHVLILVASRDLGGALIFFVTYLVLIYVATRNPGYMLLGLGGGCVGAVVAYHLFGHVRQRVSAWRDPMAVYQNEGYQIVQSLFAIGTGGWFGMGLCQGSPEKIPVVKNDFIFSAICEELGGIFAICLILVCTSFFLMIVTIALKIRNPFYKLIALGLGTEYAFQVFLTIGGATKFIPMTGVTLPLVSYGGSSVMCTILMLAIIQGLYILREDEDEEIESQRKETFERRGKRATPERTGYRQAP